MRAHTHLYKQTTERQTICSCLSSNNLATLVVYMTLINWNCYVGWRAESRLKDNSDKTITNRRRTYRISLLMVDISRVCLAIRTQNGSEIDICGVEMFLCIGFLWATANYCWITTVMSKYIYIYIYIYIFG